MSEHDEHDEPDWHALVVRSPLDDRVWCAVLPDVDMTAGAMHASTSARRCREYAEPLALRYADAAPGDLVWLRTDADTWTLTDADHHDPAQAHHTTT